MYNGAGHESICYLDDLESVDTEDRVYEAYHKLGNLLKELGVIEAENKAVPPGMIVVFLGILFNTILLQLQIKPARLEEIQEELCKWVNRKSACLRKLQSLVGKLNFCAATVRAGRLFFSQILNHMKELHGTNPFQQRKLPEEVFRDIKWWSWVMPQLDGKSMMPDGWTGPNRICSTDVCLTGIGDWSQGSFFATEIPH